MILRFSTLIGALLLQNALSFTNVISNNRISSYIPSSSKSYSIFDPLYAKKKTKEKVEVEVNGHVKVDMNGDVKVDENGDFDLSENVVKQESKNGLALESKEEVVDEVKEEVDEMQLYDEANMMAAIEGAQAS
jgi:hypothetical protein